LPADKSSFGNFEVLSQQNKRVIQEILESQSSAEHTPSHDSEILTKLRDSYSACSNEERLDSIGSAPLLRFIKTLRRLYRKEDTEISLLPGIDSGLTAAIAFLHSRGCVVVHRVKQITH
jgi:endothelin-converting enzyme